MKRQELLLWLQWNAQQGMYTDYVLRKGQPPLTRHETLAHVFHAMMRDVEERDGYRES